MTERNEITCDVCKTVFYKHTKDTTRAIINTIGNILQLCSFFNEDFKDVKKDFSLKTGNSFDLCYPCFKQMVEIFYKPIKQEINFIFRKEICIID